jgi:cytochrome P450
MAGEHRLLTCSAAIVIDSDRAILHDEATYGPDTDKFIPERWLKDGALDPAMNPDPAFGFGRRICAVSAFPDMSIDL